MKLRVIEVDFLEGYIKFELPKEVIKKLYVYPERLDVDLTPYFKIPKDRQ